MARILSQTLTRITSSPLPNSTILYSKSSPSSSPSSSPLLLSSRILIQRNRSNQSGKAQLIEVDLESDGVEVEVMGMRKLEEVIQSIIVRRSAPDWLPFIPGSSYWVPPRRRPSGMVEVVGKLTKPLSVEESLSFSSERGWPSSAYFIEGSAIMLPVSAELEVKVQDNSKNASQSEDEED